MIGFDYDRYLSNCWEDYWAPTEEEEEEGPGVDYDFTPEAQFSTSVESNLDDTIGNPSWEAMMEEENDMTEGMYELHLYRQATGA